MKNKDVKLTSRPPIQYCINGVAYTWGEDSVSSAPLKGFPNRNMTEQGLCPAAC